MQSSFANILELQLLPGMVGRHLNEVLSKHCVQRGTGRMIMRSYFGDLSLVWKGFPCGERIKAASHLHERWTRFGGKLCIWACYSLSP